MNINRFLVTAALLALGLTAGADTLSSGEWAFNLDGTPAKLGQATTDHLFVRQSGDNVPADNIVNFYNSDDQIVWLWLDDDAIYQNAKVQALTPIAYNSAGDRYHEITYHSFQCDLYLPEFLTLADIETDEGDMIKYLQGDRLPTSSIVAYQEHSATKVIDGVTYRVYRLLCTSNEDYGCHLSAKNASRYKANGALRKDDAPLLGLKLHISDHAAGVGEMPNMIIANLEFGFREAFTAVPVWAPNEYRFIYGTGGNNETQRFQYYQRVRLFGREPMELTDAPTISYRTTPGNVIITAAGKGDVVLMVDGEQVSNPCTIARGEQDVTVIATATAQEPDKDVSNVTTQAIVVPARVAVTGDNRLTVESSLMVEPGKPFDLPVALENSDDISALQCDLILPEGFTLAENAIELNGERADASHNASIRQMSDGTYRMLIASPVAAVFNGTEGDLFTLHLNVAPGQADGEYHVTMANIVLADADAATYFAPDVTALVTVKSFAKGDANGDGSVNVGDYVTTANFILGQNPDPFFFGAADVDENEAVNVGDLVGIVNIVLGDYVTNQAPRSESKPTLSGDFVSAGDHRVELTLDLKNDMPIAAWQMELAFSCDMVLTQATLSTRAGSLDLSVNKLGNGRARLLASSAVNEVIAGGEGALLTLAFDGIDADEALMSISNIVMAEPDMTTHELKTMYLGNYPVPISVNELEAGMLVYAQDGNIVVETPVDTTVDLIMTNGMTRTVKAVAGTNTYPVGHGICIVRVAGQVNKFRL